MPKKPARRKPATGKQAALSKPSRSRSRPKAVPPSRKSPRARSCRKTPKHTKTRKAGRPTLYTPALATLICARVMAGEPLRQILLLPGMPAHRDTVFGWLAEYPEFRESYTAAKQIQMDAFAEEIMDIADDSRNDWMERENARTGAVTTVLNEEAIARARLRIEARKWQMSKFAPKKFGDKVELKHSGHVDSAVTISEATRRDLMERRRVALEKTEQAEQEDDIPARPQEEPDAD